MIKTLEEMKEFILWCQENKVKSFKNNNIEVELSELAFLPESNNFDEIKYEDGSTFSDLSNLTKEETEEALFWSSNMQPKKGL